MPVQLSNPSIQHSTTQHSTQQGDFTIAPIRFEVILNACFHA